MIDYTSAVMSAAQLQRLGANVTANMSKIPQKALDSVQNEGTYDLVFPYMHKDYPTREEVEIFVMQSFMDHNMNVDYNTIVPSKQTMLKPKEGPIDGVLVKQGSAINNIGYGI
jgi:hypothetical protein